MKKFRFLLAIILVVVVCCSCLIACAFNNSQGSGNDNESNIEQDNGEIITPGDKEDENQTEIPSEPEPEPPVDPEEPENPDKPVEPTPDEDKELDISGFSDKLSEWNESQVKNLITGITNMYGEEFFYESRGQGALYNGRDFSIVALQLNKNNNSINTLIKYYASSDTEKNYRLAEKAINFTECTQVGEYLKKVSAYNSLTNNAKEKYETPKTERVTFEKSQLYLSVNLKRNEELDGSRMGDFAKVLNSLEKFGKINQVLYAKNYQTSLTSIGALCENETRWVANALVLNKLRQLQLVNLDIGLHSKLSYNTADKILDFANWKEEDLKEGIDFRIVSSSITSDKTFGGENAVFLLPDFYEN